ncbi:SLC13 family permease [Methylocapsa aurea]|uniref:SLC13 family permease n=1 Tax=Methylocapsa aurea TaxID=663610 RepID=UPI001FD8C015|nr:anion transporter [Methylocapsa aurea]
MNLAAFDWRMLATGTIFIATLAGVALGRAPGLRIDRAGMALVGAALMLAIGALSLEDALRAVDLETIALLLGMMIIVAQLRLSGFFELAGRFAIKRAHGPFRLLAAIVMVTGFFSAFLVNDVICLVMAPLVIDVARALRRNPAPYLLAVAMASNAGSVATFTGNPQNMIVGVASDISYLEFAHRLAPIAVVALALTLGLIRLLFPREFAAPFETAPAEPRPRRHFQQMAKGALMTAGVVAGFVAGAPVAKVALIGGALLFLSRAVKPQKIYAGINGELLLMFAGLFVVVAAAERTLLTPEVVAAARQLHFDNVWVLSGATAVLSNLVSNVPAVLVLQPLVADLANPDRGWLIIAMSSTLAGNLTLIGSVANLIVVEQARRAGAKISFLAYMRVGLPLTLLSIGFGAWWLALER